MLHRTGRHGFLGSCLTALVCLAAAALLLSACSRGGRSNPVPAAETAGTTIPMSGAHVSIQLRDRNGTPIDITQPESAPYSPKQTCGYCHNYHAIEEG